MLISLAPAGLHLKSGAAEVRKESLGGSFGLIAPASQRVYQGKAYYSFRLSKVLWNLSCSRLGFTGSAHRLQLSATGSGGGCAPTIGGPVIGSWLFTTTVDGGSGLVSAQMNATTQPNTVAPSNRLSQKIANELW
jgi:hypothetical protein